MEPCREMVEPGVLALHRPYLDSLVTTLMKGWSQWKVDDIAQALGISGALAASFLRMAYDFPDKTTGCKALEAFTGVVFKALDYSSLTADERHRADSRIDIISSAYGWLRGGDIIKPYRLDYASRMAPGDLSMAAYWKPVITSLLLDSMQKDGEEMMLDLLPAEAAKCLDWRIIRRQVNVIKVTFRSLKAGGSVKTPHATLLKTLRGKLLREIIHRDIRSVTALAALETDTMYVDPDSDPASGTLTILTC